MTTSEGSSSHTVSVKVSSDVFKDFPLRDLDVYKNYESDRVVMHISTQKCFARDPESGEVTLGSLAILSLTYGDVVKILKKIEGIVSNTEVSLAHKLDKLFGDGSKKYYGPSPGTLRVFGNGLASFYDGNGWRKVRLNKEGGNK